VEEFIFWSRDGLCSPRGGGKAEVEGGATTPKYLFLSSPRENFWALGELVQVRDWSICYLLRECGEKRRRTVTFFTIFWGGGPDKIRKRGHEELSQWTEIRASR